MENLSDNFEFQQVRATAEAAKITADRTNRGMRILESSVKTQKTFTTGSVVIVMCMLLLGIGGVWWMNTQLKKQGSSIGELLGLQQDVEKLSRRMSTAEVALSTYPADLRNVEGRVDALDKRGTTVARAQVPVHVHLETAQIDAGRAQPPFGDAAPNLEDGDAGRALGPVVAQGGKPVLFVL